MMSRDESQGRMIADGIQQVHTTAARHAEDVPDAEVGYEVSSVGAEFHISEVVISDIPLRLFIRFLRHLHWPHPPATIPYVVSQ